MLSGSKGKSPANRQQKREYERLSVWRLTGIGVVGMLSVMGAGKLSV
jgi:hypothetical protein